MKYRIVKETHSYPEKVVYVVEKYAEGYTLWKKVETWCKIVERDTIEEAQKAIDELIKTHANKVTREIIKYP